MIETGIVTIGRNEGERLKRCLASVLSSGFPVVYVDSKSTDGSVSLARSMGAEVVELDMSTPFSAARARNAGLDRLTQMHSSIRFVQFIDGDCEVAAGWLQRAQNDLAADPAAAAVCGRRRERFPKNSVYNQIADIEWNTPVGEVKSCGGAAMVRADAFTAAGGYDPTIVAGEEPELCQRLREKGWKILRIDAEMTLHDSAMTKFAQWWRRAIRSGYGAMDVATRFGHGKDGLFVRQVRSARLWGILFPLLLILVGVTIGLSLGRLAAALALLFFLVVLLLQMLRTAVKARKRTDSWSAAIACGVLTMIAKWANLIGQLRYWRDRASGHNARLIEYKLSPAR